VKYSYTKHLQYIGATAGGTVDFGFYVMVSNIVQLKNLPGSLISSPKSLDKSRHWYSLASRKVQQHLDHDSGYLII